jgi:acyl carrier protein
VLLDEIPKGPTGKVQRIGLAEKLGLTAGQARLGARRPDFVAPRTPVEEALAEKWAQVLGVEQVGVHDDFFELGGDSMLATQIVSRVRTAMRVELAPLSFFETATVADLAATVTDQIEEAEREEMAQILAELEELSEEEAERLLADATQDQGES